jgi:hypothetical protein
VQQLCVICAHSFTIRPTWASFGDFCIPGVRNAPSRDRAGGSGASSAVGMSNAVAGGEAARSRYGTSIEVHRAPAGGELCVAGVWSSPVGSPSAGGWVVHPAVWSSPVGSLRRGGWWVVHRRGVEFARWVTARRCVVGCASPSVGGWWVVRHGVWSSPVGSPSAGGWWVVPHGVWSSPVGSLRRGVWWVVHHGRAELAPRVTPRGWRVAHPWHARLANRGHSPPPPRPRRANPSRLRSPRGSFPAPRARVVSCSAYRCASSQASASTRRPGRRPPSSSPAQRPAVVATPYDTPAVRRRAAARARACSCSTWRRSSSSVRRRLSRTEGAATRSAIQPKMPPPGTP